MAGFYFKLENEDGTPGDPPVLHTGRTELERRRHHNASLGFGRAWSRR